MMKTNALTAFSVHPGTAIDRALNLLAAGGFRFEIVDRCSADCEFCNDELTQAA
ncbi:MAG: hypothetical protein GY720_17590 [bacterium]|nr:hypothetical protein [bacterium]